MGTAEERTIPTGRPSLLLFFGVFALLVCCCSASMGSAALWLLARTPGGTAAITSVVAARGVLGPEGGVLEAPGVHVLIPKGALAGSTTVTIAAPAPAPPSPDRNLVVLGDVHRIEVAGALAGEAELTLDYDPAKLAGKRPEDVVALVFRGRGYEPVKPAHVDAAAHRITVKTRHFSDWTAGVVQSPATPARSHPKLPFDVTVVDSVRAKVSPKFVDAAYRSIEKAYDVLTTHNPTRPWLLPEPPFADGKRLVVLVTDLAPVQGLYASVGGAAAVTVSDELMLMGCDATPGEPLWNDVVHEFVHAIQWRSLKQAQARGRNASFLSWTAEATACYAASVVVPNGLGDVAVPATRLFCYEELIYTSLANAARPGSAQHQYEAQAFVAYLVTRFGPSIVGALIGESFGGAATDLEALETVVKDASHGRQKLFQVYREFVRDHEFTHVFGSKPLYGLSKETLLPPPGKVVDLEPAKGGESSVELPARALMIPSAVRIPIPEDGLRLDVTLAGSGWLWAFAGTTKLLGGDATKLSFKIDKGVREVFLLPVSGAPQTLVVKAKLAVDRTPKATWVLTKRSPIVIQEKLGYEPDANRTGYQRFLVAPDSLTIDTFGYDRDKKPVQEKLAFRVTKGPPARLVEGEPLELALEGKIEKAPEGHFVDVTYHFGYGSLLELKAEGRDAKANACRIDMGHREDRIVYRGKVGHNRFDDKKLTIDLGVNLAPESVSGSHWTLVTWEDEPGPTE